MDNKKYAINYNKLKISQLEDPPNIKEIINIGVRQFLGISPSVVSGKTEKYNDINQGCCTDEMIDLLVSRNIIQELKNNKHDK